MNPFYMRPGEIWKYRGDVADWYNDRLLLILNSTHGKERDSLPALCLETGEIVFLQWATGAYRKTNEWELVI